MGRGSTFYCQTCKVSHYLGYGCYGTWLDHCKTLEEFAKADNSKDQKSLDKNKRMRKALEKHEGHEFSTHSEDWAHTHGSDATGDRQLCGEFGYGGSCVPLFSMVGWNSEELETE